MGLFDHLFKSTSSARGEINQKPGGKPGQPSRIPSPAATVAAGHPRPVLVPSPKAYSPRSLGTVITPGGSRTQHFRSGMIERPGVVRRDARSIVVTLNDILPRIPIELLSGGSHDRERELHFRLDELSTDFSRGRVAVAITKIVERVPELFRQPISEEILIRLPLHKIIEQLGRKPSRLSPSEAALPMDPDAPTQPGPAVPAGEVLISLSLAAILRTCPPEILKAVKPAVADTDKVTFPFAPIERQLPHGKVDVSSRRFIAALPPALAGHFEARDDVRVSLPLDEIFLNLPAQAPEAARSQSPHPTVAPVPTQPPTVPRSLDSPRAWLESEKARKRGVTLAKDSIFRGIEVFKRVAAPPSETPFTPSEPAPTQDPSNTPQPAPIIQSDGMPDVPDEFVEQAGESPAPDSPPPVLDPERSAAVSAATPPPDAPVGSTATEELEIDPLRWVYTNAPLAIDGPSEPPAEFLVSPEALPTSPFPVHLLEPPPAFESPEADALATDAGIETDPLTEPASEPEPSRALELEATASLIGMSGEVSLADIANYFVTLTGLRACVLNVRHESEIAGEWPAGFDDSVMPELFPAFSDAVADREERLGIGAVQHLTVFADDGCVTFFSKGTARLAVYHRPRVFLPGVREKLSAVLILMADA